MVKVRLPFEQPNKTVDQATPRNNIWEIQDGRMDIFKNLKRRPGLLQFADLELDVAIDGLYWWDSLEVLIVVSNGSIYSYDQIGQKTSISGGSLAAGNPCTFAEIYDQDNSQLILCIANNSPIVYTDGSTAANISAVDSNVPGDVTHVAAINTYLCCNSRSSGATHQWFASTVGKPLDWTTSPGTYVAEQIPDQIEAILEHNRKLYIFGSESIEVWEDTGAATPWVPLNGVNIRQGIVSGSACVKGGNILTYFNKNREIMLLDTYYPENISWPYSRYIEDLSAINDIEIDYISLIDGSEYFLYNFVDAGVSLVYDLTMKRLHKEDWWYQWGYWDADSNDYGRFKGRGYAFSKSWNKHFMGDFEDSLVHYISDEYYDDNGDTISQQMITGKYGHGILDYKQSYALFSFFCRGDGKYDDKFEVPHVWLSWRDDNKEQWGNEVQVNLGAVGDREIADALAPMGRYRNRQYRLRFGDSANLVFMGFEEELNASKIARN